MRNRYSGDGARPFRNRTLVIQQPASPSETSSGSVNHESSDAWVQKRDRHFQLINKTVYDKMAEEKTQNQPGQFMWQDDSDTCVVP